MAGFILAALAAIAILAAPAAAQSDYPNRPIQLIVPYGPGGVADVGMRIMAEKLSIRLKQNVVIENRPGAGGIVAAKAVATAAPDGYNVLMTGNNNAIAVALFKSLPYDILKDFASTSTVSFFDLLIVDARPTRRCKSLQDVVKAAKANPGKLNIGTINPGSTQNLAAELFKNVTGIKVHDRAVPHLGRHGDRAAARRPRCHVRVLHRGARAPRPTRRSSRSPRPGPSAAPICRTCRPRSRPASRTSRFVSWNGLSVPAATPKPVIDTLVKGLNDVLPDPSIQERSKTLGMEMRGGTPAEMDKRMKDDIVKWGAVIEKAGIEKSEIELRSRKGESDDRTRSRPSHSRRRRLGRRHVRGLYVPASGGGSARAAGAAEAVAAFFAKFLPWVWVAILLLLASGYWMVFMTFGGFARAAACTST